MSTTRPVNSTICFTLVNGSLFESDAKIWELSGLVSVMLKNNENEDESVIFIPLNNISLEYLIKVVDFLNIYSNNPDTWKTIEKPINSVNIYEIVPSIYADYIQKMTDEEVIALASAADYLDIKQLLDLTSLRIAILLKPHYENGSKEEVKKILGIKI